MGRSSEALLLISFHPYENIPRLCVGESHEIGDPIRTVVIKLTRLSWIQELRFEFQELILRRMLQNKVANVGRRNLADQLPPDRHINIIPDCVKLSAWARAGFCLFLRAGIWFNR